MDIVNWLRITYISVSLKSHEQINVGKDLL